MSAVSLSSAVDKIVDQFLQRNDVPGAMVSIQQGGSTIFSQGYGIQGPSGTVPSETTTFQIDSLTKVFTAMAVLKLSEQGTISNLTDPISKYVQNLTIDVPLPVEWSEIQIIELLAMVSGIPDYFSTTNTYLETLEEVGTHPVNFPPATCYEYSNPNYMLLGVLIDTISAEGFSGYVQSIIFDALGMSGTGLIDQSDATNPATPYESGGKIPENWRSPYCGYSAGGFASTMSDLQAFAEGLAAGAILSSASYDLMWTRFSVSGCTCNTNSKITPTCPFGLGWLLEVDSSSKTTKAQKNGGGAGWGSELIYCLPSEGDDSLTKSVIVVINADGRTGLLANQILTALQSS